MSLNKQALAIHIGNIHYQTSKNAYGMIQKKFILQEELFNMTFSFLMNITKLKCMRGNSIGTETLMPLCSIAPCCRMR